MQLTAFAIYKLFRPFGRINNFIFVDFTGWRFDIATFLDDPDPLQFEFQCQRVAENCGFEIVHKRRITVYVPERNLSRAIVAPANSVQDSSETIADILNDDCLLAIFESPMVRATELLSLAYTCKRFHSIAKKAFSKKIITNNLFGNMELWQTEKFFRTFGEHIKSVDICSVGLCESDVRLCLMLEHCKNITTLICHVSASRHTPIDYIPLARGDLLENLSIYYMNNYNCRSNFLYLFNANAEYRLKKLVISSQELVLPRKRLSQLETVTLSNNSHVSSDILPFFELNSQIKSLKLEHVKLTFDTSQILDHLPNLMELKLKFVRNKNNTSSTENFGGYRRLNRLKLLSIVSVQDDQILHIIKALCEGQIQLEKLEWPGKCEEPVIDAICNIKSITHLKLTQANTNRNLARLATNLKSLVYIRFECETLEGVHNVLRSALCLKEAICFLKSRALTEQQNASELLDQIDVIRCKRCLRLTVYLGEVRYFLLQLLKHDRKHLIN